MRSCPHCLTPYSAQVEFCGIDGSRIEAFEVDPLLGRDLDRYQILEHLGDGGMARVYRAAHQVLEREYAVKVLFGEVASNKTLAERFRREANTISRMSHENIVSVVDYGRTPEGLTFLIMELVEGQTLRHIIKRQGPMAPARASHIARQIAEGLAEAHQQGFVHRDLKPSNVMLVGEQPQEHVKLLDFGLVRAEPEEEGAFLTKTGQFVGTPIYMAPEQIIGADVDDKADLYALGVVLFEMLEGAPPFKAKKLSEIRKKHLTAAPPPIRPSRGLEKLVEELLAKAVEARPKSARAVIDRLDALDLALGAAVPMLEGPAQEAEVTQRSEAPIFEPKEVPALLEDPPEDPDRTQKVELDLERLIEPMLALPELQDPAQTTPSLAPLSAEPAADTEPPAQIEPIEPIERADTDRSAAPWQVEAPTSELSPELAEVFDPERDAQATVLNQKSISSMRAEITQAPPAPGLDQDPMDRTTQLPKVKLPSFAAQKSGQELLASSIAQPEPSLVQLAKPGSRRHLWFGAILAAAVLLVAIVMLRQGFTQRLEEPALIEPLPSTPEAPAAPKPAVPSPAPPPEIAPPPTDAPTEPPTRSTFRSTRRRRAQRRTIQKRLKDIDRALRRSLSGQNLSLETLALLGLLTSQRKAYSGARAQRAPDDAERAAQRLTDAAKALRFKPALLERRLSRLSAELSRASNTMSLESLKPFEDRYLELAQAHSTKLSAEEVKRLMISAARLSRALRAKRP